MKKYNKFKIILPTSVHYLDITIIFLKLLKINWPSAMSHVVISTIGRSPVTEKLKEIAEVVENPNTATLPECILNASHLYTADIYLVFLGDAFIYKRVNEKLVANLIDNLITNEIEYCRLDPQFSFFGERKSKFYRLLNTNERYGHSFVAFAASPKFILKEFANSKNYTDRDFEIKYLRLANSNKREYFKRDAILKKNYFNILPSIQKGKWDAKNMLLLKKKYPKIDFSNRATISWKYELILIGRNVMLPVIPNKLRMYIKNKFNKKSYFDTNI
ncbi:hypothetical protein IMAU30115_01425 [Lactobacillus helveticus]|uniref:hypothetical protein n=1 Tax=Lactobacillus helveticus TaxID=1587 RepID=UPI0015626C89|nr:hypothetical protein [Lactobacillus helveticus]NRN81026.1 hypothetical protein [Lactobacillus helveticus]NRO24780.1 hypothetical protein [Lactobacillus helveticus]